MLAHEMQVIAKVMIAKEAGLGAAAVAASLRDSMPEFATHEDFPDLFRFVIEVGGARAPFLADLRSSMQFLLIPNSGGCG